MKPPRSTAKKKSSTRPTRRPPSELIELSIVELSSDGIGIARNGQRRVLVAGAFPGEKVLAHIIHRGQRQDIGALQKVVTPCSDRVPSPCRAARKCLGCPLISWNIAAQHRFKFERVRTALREFGELHDLPVEPLHGAPQPLGYRNQAKLAVGGTHRHVRIGLYRRGSHDIVDIDNCPLHHPLINRIVAVVKEEITRQKVLVYDQRRRRGLLRYLSIRVSPANNKALVTFVTTERNYQEMTALAKWLKRKVPEVVGVHENINPSEGNVIFGHATFKLLGVDDLFDQVGDVRLRLTPTAFFQVNHDQAAYIYRLAQHWLEPRPNDTVLDLYCGIGGIALHLAAQAGQVIGIESNADAIYIARRNASLNKLNNCEFLAGTAEELLPRIAADLSSRPHVVVNPPRSGCDAAVIETLLAIRPQKLVYVSCQPDTLARDLALLVKGGFRPVKVQPVDMFPQTPHVESVALLEGRFS